ncbi:GntR family transcriptional regulator [Actinomadura sp.]|jgi:DNA-binding GntR family transcriptional regulator|uniref:GntR family transcriptional regulator n=1 Tax=Actinomadura sp. TaxID=1989 RepID=UPI0037C673C0
MAGNDASAAKVKYSSPEVRVPPYEMLKNAILSGELKAGQPLVEASLAAWCQVSRTPIREALRRLEQDGLIERSDRGLVIRERSPQEILDIYETRIALEATAGRMAAERRTDHDIRLLRGLWERGNRIPPEDITAIVEANRQFHRAVWLASHNDSLLDLLERLNLHLLRYPETTLAAPGRWKVARDQHGELVDAIEKRDPEGAYQVAMQHFADARDIRLSLFAEEVSEL